MGYLNVSARIAVLSFGLLALAGCQDASPGSKKAADWPPGDSELIVCPGDRRCGEQDATPDPRAATCRVNQTRLKFKCGEQDLPCPGAGCPTGEPGLPAQQCWISETFLDMRCPSAGPGPVADETTPAEPTAVEPAETPAPVPAPAG